MSNLSKIKRQEMLDYISQLKAIHNDDESIIALNNIENALTEKKYGLVWEEHSEKVDEMLEHHIPVFEEVKDKKIEVDPEKGFNFLLEGDNLHSLKLLEKTHKGKIDVIYIDPPYNTKNKDFIYNDERIGEDDTYRHSKWLSFMNERLLLAKKLLSEDGIIFISIDDNELAQLKLLCDEVMGEKNFINCIAVKMSESTGVKMTHVEKRLPKLKEYVLFYRKNQNSNASINEIKIPKGDWDNEYKILVKGVTKEELNVIKNVMYSDDVSDEEFELANSIGKKFVFTNVNTEIKNLKVSEQKEYLIENSYRIFRDVATSGGAKRIADEKRKSDEISSGAFLIRTPQNKIYLIRGDYNLKSKQPRMKLLFADDYLETHVGDFWHDIKTTGLGAEGDVNFLNGKKPLKLVKRVINLCIKTDAVVLDFFAGSGTTGHAVAQLNKEDGGNRKYILCTNNENNICEEVTYQRLKNIQEDLPHNFKYFKTDFIDKLSEDEDILSDRLLTHIKEMVELENMCEIDGVNRVLVLTEDDLATWLTSEIEPGASLYLPSYILLSREEENLCREKSVTLIDIPDYYFLDELREAREI